MTPEEEPIARKGIRYLLTLYKCFSRLCLSPRCRFYPSCSEYAAYAIDRHGFFKGGRLALRRLSKCHPWSACSGGCDPCPPREKS